MPLNPKPARLIALITILAVSVLFLMLFQPFRSTGPAEEAAIRDFSILYRQTLQVYQRTNWLGTKIQQTPTDMWAIQEIMVQQKPDFIIETGTLKGGSALFFATIFHAIKDSGRVITVNIEEQTDPATEALPIFQEHVIQIIGDAASEETIQKIAAIVQGRPALVLLDDNHDWSHVLKELPLYAPFVHRGGYLVVCDTNYDTYAPQKIYPAGGPLKAIRKYLEAGAPFEIDLSREKFLLTFFPQGYLRRVRD
jgi:cephalosporin hydroxylase